jgi:hypothetical protein
MRIRSIAVATLSSALLIGAVVPASAQDDPYQLLAQAVQATSSATSFHVLVTADGSINLGEMMGDKPITIDGTQAEGDISVNPLTVSLTFDVPIQGLSISGGVIVPNDGSAYVKLALPIGSADDLWHRIPVGDLNVPTTIASPAPGEDKAAELKSKLDGAGVTLTNAGDATCAAGTCTKLHLEIPASAFESTIDSVLPMGSPAPSAAPAAPIPADILIDKASGRLDSVSAPISDEASGSNATLSVALSGYDQPLTVAAPPADQVTDQPLLKGMLGD